MEKMEKNLETLIREEKNKYHREWCKKNPEKAKAIHQRYWAKKVTEQSESENGNGKNEND